MLYLIISIHGGGEYVVAFELKHVYRYYIIGIGKDDGRITLLEIYSASSIMKAKRYADKMYRASGYLFSRGMDRMKVVTTRTWYNKYRNMIFFKP